MSEPMATDTLRLLVHTQAHELAELREENSRLRACNMKARPTRRATVEQDTRLQILLACLDLEWADVDSAPRRDIRKTVGTHVRPEEYGGLSDLAEACGLGLSPLVRLLVLGALRSSRGVQ